MRKIISISASRRSVIALCDDGTVWEGSHVGSRVFTWIRLPDIPAPPSIAATGGAAYVNVGGGCGGAGSTGESSASGGNGKMPDLQGIVRVGKSSNINATEQVVNGGAFINLTKLREQSK